MGCGLSEQQILALIAGAGATAFANPSGLIGLSPVNGVAATALRSDGHSAIDQGIVPTWTGMHSFAFKQSRHKIGNSAGFGLGLVSMGTSGSINGIASTGAGVSPFSTFNFPASAFDQVGRRARFSFWGNSNNDGTSTTSLELILDGTQIFYFQSNFGGNTWKLETEFFRINATEVEGVTTLIAANIVNVSRYRSTYNFANATTLQLNGDGPLDAITWFGQTANYQQ